MPSLMAHVVPIEYNQRAGITVFRCAYLVVRQHGSITNEAFAIPRLGGTTTPARPYDPSIRLGADR